MMETKSFEEFKSYYFNTNKFLYPMVNYSSKPLNDSTLSRKYTEYCSKIDKLNMKEEEKYWDKKIKMMENILNKDTVELSEYAQKVNSAMEQVHKENNSSCYNNFYNSLSNEEKDKLDCNMWLCPKDSNGNYVFDGAHIIERSICPQLAYEVENIVLLPRYLHSCLDNYKNPFTDKNMNEKQHEELWIRIVGKERWEKLHKMKK